MGRGAGAAADREGPPSPAGVLQRDGTRARITVPHLAACLRAEGLSPASSRPATPTPRRGPQGLERRYRPAPRAVAATDADDVAAAIRTARSLRSPTRSGRRGPRCPGARCATEPVPRPPRASTASMSIPSGRSCAWAAAPCSASLMRRRRRSGWRCRRARSRTGVGGLTLGGGLGWLMRGIGLTIDSLLSPRWCSPTGRSCRVGDLASGPTPLGAARRRRRLRRGHRVRVPRHRVGPTVLGVLIYQWEQAEGGVPCRPLADGRRARGSHRLRGAGTAALGSSVPSRARGRPGRGDRGGVVRRSGLRRAVARAALRADCAADLVGEMPFVALQSMLDARRPRLGLLRPAPLLLRGWGRLHRRAARCFERAPARRNRT